MSDTFVATNLQETKVYFSLQISDFNGLNLIELKLCLNICKLHYYFCQSLLVTIMLIIQDFAQSLQNCNHLIRNNYYFCITKATFDGLELLNT